MDMLREKLSITKAELDTAVKHLEKKYSGDCGIRLLTFNHKLQMATNPDYKDPVASVLNPIREKEFTKTILECAAIIAYKQPITRSELETVRGVNSDYAVTTLISLDMIAACRQEGRARQAHSVCYDGQFPQAIQVEIARGFARLRRADAQDRRAECGERIEQQLSL